MTISPELEPFFGINAAGGRRFLSSAGSCDSRNLRASHLRPIRYAHRHGTDAAAMTSADKSDPQAELAILRELEKKVLWLASWTIHHANHVRDNIDGLKVGGHQASSASLATIMTALYFRELR